MTNLRNRLFGACLASFALLSSACIAFADGLKDYSDKAYRESTVPTMALVVKENCAKCAALESSLQELAAKYPGYLFLKGTVDTALVKPESLPFLAVRIPGKKEHVALIPAYKADTSADYLLAFLRNRIKSAEIEAILYEEYLKARFEYRVKRRPYEELMDQLESVADQATAVELNRKKFALQNWRDAQERFEAELKSLSELKE